MKQLTFFFTLSALSVFAQKETKVKASIDRVTIFKEGAQVGHQEKVNLSAGKQTLVFEQLTDFVDPNSVQLKCSSNAVILSVRTRKNFDESSVSKLDLTSMNSKKKVLETEEQKLRDEYIVLLRDEQLLLKNDRLGSQQQGVKVAELKEASVFYHSKLTEIQARKSQVTYEIEALIRKINTIEQEINTKRSIPVKNYTELEVEIEAEKAGSTDFQFSYITPNASWKPYYDLRSDGIGAPVLLEAKGLITQNTGIEWKNVKLVLSTNDPYDNTQEPIIYPWNLDYNTYAPRKEIVSRSIPSYNYSGELVHGEVLDAVSGEPLAFAKLSMSRNYLQIFTTDADGRFSFIVPRDENAYSVSYLGYENQYININAPYTKILLNPQDIAMDELRYENDNQNVPLTDGYAYDKNELEEVQIMSQSKVATRKLSRKNDQSYAAIAQESKNGFYANAIAETVEKDLRIEYQIETPFTVPSDNADHRVAIAVYDLKANYEYHSVPKLDESVFLVAQVSGWEKLNLLSGESNLYFDGTFIGKSYIDVNSVKDTLSFSLGKDKKIVVERKRIEELSKTRSIGNRNKYEVTWDFTIRNNGVASIPFILKDHFPISLNNDIKVKQGSYEGGTLDETTGIITWKMNVVKGEIKKLKFDYSIDYGKEQPVYFE